MKISRSPVTTAIAALPSKFVKYRTFGSDVTTRASSDRAVRASRIARCRSLRSSVGACDMDGVEPQFERGNDPFGALPFGLVRHGTVALGLRQAEGQWWRRSRFSRGRVPPYRRFIALPG